MGFRFKLEALRSYRQHQEEMRQKELADCMRRRDATAAKLKELLIQREQTESASIREQIGSTTGSHLSMYVSYLQRLEENIVEQRERWAMADKECDAKRESLMEAVKKRKALEKLKEKGLKNYMENLDHEELKFIDEIAINRFNLNR
jgi:flagellar FliJ protein